MITLPPETKMGLVALTVSDLDRSLRFYINTLGLALIQHEDHSALLGAGGEALLDLVELPGARPKPPRTTGLYHFAILPPSRSIWRVTAPPGRGSLAFARSSRSPGERSALPCGPRR